MDKNKTSEIVTTVVAGLSTLWTSYKRSARRRNEDPMMSFWNDLFGSELNDVDAAKLLAKDVAEIRNSLRVKKTDKKFKNIINNSY